MAVLVQKTFTTICNGDLLIAINADSNIAPVLLQILNDPGTPTLTDFWFDVALSGAEDTYLDGLLAGWTCPTVQGESGEGTLDDTGGPDGDTIWSSDKITTDFVNVPGDTMTGTLTLSSGNINVDTGDIRVGHTFSSGYTLSVQSNTASTYIEILNSTGANQGVFFGIENFLTPNDFCLYNYQAGPITFYTDTAVSSEQRRMVIQPDGDVEIKNLTAGVVMSAVDGTLSSSATVPDGNISESSVTQHVGAIDHDSLLNFVANEHATPKNSLEIDTGQIQLVGDAAAPGNTKLYGTNGTGTKGWYDQPSGGGTPGGGDHDVQYNNNGSFGGESNFQYDDTLNTVFIGGTPEMNMLQIGGNFTGSPVSDTGNATLYIEVNTTGAGFEGLRTYFNRGTPGISGWILYHYDGNTPNIRIVDEDDDPPYVAFQTIGTGTLSAPQFDNRFLSRGGVANVTTGFSWEVNGTEVMDLDSNHLGLPAGTTANRPSPASNGMVRYNTTTDKLEGYENGSWENLVEGGGTGNELASITVGRTSNISIPTSWGDVTWQSTHVENDTTVIEHDNTNTDRILIKETGLYFISFSISFDADSGEEQIEARVRVDDTTIVPGSHRVASEDDEINDLSNAFTAELTSGTYLTLQHTAAGSGNVLHSSSNFSVTRAKGAKGDTGATGSGTSINIQDDGSPLPNTPHDTINIIGNSSVSDAGGGVANVTIMRPTFCIWAEENSSVNVSTNNYEYSFGNGAVNSTANPPGIPMGVNCTLIGIGVSARNTSSGTSTVSVSVTNNGTIVSTGGIASASGVNNKVQNHTNVTPDTVNFAPGDTLQFLTASASGTLDDVRVVAWFERTS